MSENHCLILFVKAPVHGEVKTRLASKLGHDRTLDLYRRMLQRQIALVNGYDNARRQLWVSGDTSHPDLQDFAGDVIQQQGGDIGARMQHALQQALTRHASAVLIGCDCPGINNAYLAQAFDVLSSGSDAVLGPATDGGYILIGLRKSDEALFSGIDWGTERVLAQTRSRLTAGAYSWRELEPLHDIDEADDLEKLALLVEREYGV